MKTTYKATTAPVWIRKPGITGCPATVSGRGSLPSPREAYELAHRWSIEVTDCRGNMTYHNTWYGFRIESKEDAEDMARFLARHETFRAEIRDIAAANDGKSVLDVFRLWEAYAAECSAFDQSPVFGEFETWHNLTRSTAA